MKRNFVLCILCLLLTLMFAVSGSNAAAKGSRIGKNILRTVTVPLIVDRPVRITETRERLAREYSLLHYGKEMTEIVPRAVIVHWTESESGEGVYRYFYRERMKDGTLNVCSQFLVDRDGTIFRLTPETMLDRHAIGYNWCAIGIENVGGKGGREDLTEAQLQANVALIRYLHEKYPEIKYMWGHYQQTKAKQSGLFKEKVAGYFHEKADPGPKFMTALQKRLEDTGLLFFKP